MTEQDLQRTAADLNAPSSEALEEYAAKRETLVAEVNRIMLARPDLEELIGPANTAMMQDNHHNHSRFVASILRHPNPEVLVETVLWVYRAYRSHGFQLTYWPAQLNAWVEVMKRELSENTFLAIYPLYYWFIVNQAAFVKLTDAEVNTASCKSPC
jgi:hypothetical protein